jgi:predicted Zn-dependent protease
LASKELPAARRELDVAMRLDPLSVPILVDAASFYIESGDPMRALAEAQTAVELDPASNSARLSLGSALLAQSRLTDAVTVFRAAAAAEPENGRALQFLSGVYLRLGRRSEAEETIARLLDLANRRAVTCDVASAYASAGQSGLALDWLDQAVEARSTCIGWLRLDRFAASLAPFRALSNTARYRAILAKAVPNQ